ncbi:uncharacterized protein LOC143887829 [Tasmannia lanceolata]|uniref:uncharacterized protein LOC143887829 n=1 Tax=Tasmannia lanceolata TaxID=3420 RepID=UPI0040646A8B
MQSGYGVPEIQQFMVDSSCSSLSSMAQQNQQQNHHHHHQNEEQRFHYVQPIPITQQFFQHHNQFQPFQNHTRLLHSHLGLDQESAPENSNSPSRIAGAPPPFVAMNFMLGLNENRGSREGLNDEDTLLRGEDGSDSRAAAVHPWEEGSAIKEPFWKPLDIEFMNKNNKRCKEKVEISNKYSKKPEEENENEEGKSSGSNYGFFSELEAIYTRSNTGGGNNQAGSGSALTGDNNPPAPAVTRPAGYPNSGGIDHGSETSTGEEASLKKVQKNKRKRKEKQSSSIAMFFEKLIKQLMDHQESLHRKFLEVMERRDEERTNREEAWRRQELAKSNREAIFRAQERALASSREAAIVSFLEKITGETINLPSKDQIVQFESQFHEETQKEVKDMEYEAGKTDNKMDNTNTRRWPKAEVQVLIRVRSGLESRFQEPGLKGPLWEEVSSSMALLGYHRSSKRCKEKWENINKYFRKTKDTAKKRPQHSKTCPYFHQLDQLYSKSSSLSAKPSVSSAVIEQPKDNSELLDAMVVPLDPNPSLGFAQEQLEIERGFKFPEMESLRSNYDEEHGNEEEEDEEEDDEGEEGEGEGENEENVQNQVPEREHKEEYQRKPMFFGLES